MGLFGDQDAEEVSDNPFYVAPDIYRCTLAEATVQEKKEEKGGGQGISFKWVITDEDSDYHGNNLSDWHNIYPEVTSDELTADIRRDQARMKKRLIEMEVTPEEMNVLLDDDNLENLIGMEADLEVSETPDKVDPNKMWTNVKRVFNVERV